MSARSDRGQLLIITGLALVILIAIGALVVDLGFSWMLRRHEQNAADAAVVAAARHLRNATTGLPAWNQAAAEQEACFAAVENEFFPGATSYDLGLTGCVPGNDPNGTRLEVHSPPIDGQYSGRPGFVEVKISSTHPSFFAQIFDQDWATVSTDSVAANTAGNSNSSSLVALGSACTGNDSGDSAITGGGSVTIQPATGVTAAGGYVQVNADCGTSRDDVCQSGTGVKGAASLAISGQLRAPYTYVVGSCTENGTGVQPQCTAASPCVDEGAIPLGDPLQDLAEPWPTVNLPAPACPGAADINSPADDKPCTLKGGNNGTCPLVATAYTCTMAPGVYYAGWDVQSNVKVVLKPGMYVFAGFGIKIASGSSLETVTGQDAAGAPIDARVTIFSTDYTAGCTAGHPNFCEGSINITAQGDLRLKATDATTCQQVSPQICPWTGILLWQDGTTVKEPADVNIQGSSNLILSGTIYAPLSYVKIAGGNTSTGCSGAQQACLSIQVISESWEISGKATVILPYDPSQLYQLDQRGLVD